MHDYCTITLHFTLMLKVFWVGMLKVDIKHESILGSRDESTKLASQVSESFAEYSTESSLKTLQVSGSDSQVLSSDY